MVRVLIVLAFLVTAAARAEGQTEWRLGPDGGWVKASEPQPGTDEAFIAGARTLLAERKFAGARRKLTRWLDQHQYTDNPYLAEAYLLRGDARQAMGDEFLALYDYKKITTDFPSTKVFVTALERELAIGVKYLNGMKRRFLGIRWYSAETEAEEMLTRIQEQMPSSVLAERAGFELLRYYYRTVDLKQASEMGFVFMQNFPRSGYRARVLEYRINSNLGLYAGPQYDGSYLIEARELIRQYMAEFPAEAERTGTDEAAVARIDESEAEQVFEVARWYLRRGEAASARFTLHRLVHDHGLTVAASRGYQILVDKGWSVGLSPPGPGAEPVGSPAEEPAGAPPAGAGGEGKP
jgi:hypothetical protein